MLMMNAKAIFRGIVCLFITSHIFNIFIFFVINILVIPTSSYYIHGFFLFLFSIHLLCNSQMRVTLPSSRMNSKCPPKICHPKMPNPQRN